MAEGSGDFLFDEAGGTERINARASILTVDLLFHPAVYEIPSYQREYSWETPQVKALAGDLIESYFSRDAKSGAPIPQYFLGAIVSQERSLNEHGRIDRSNKIVDGQQRLTSLLLFIAALCKLLTQKSSGSAEDEDANTQQRELLNLIYRPDRDHFILNSKGYNYYLRQLMGGGGGLPPKLPGNPPFRTSALLKFCKAFELFEAEIRSEIARSDALTDKDGLDRAALVDFADWLRHHVFIALVADTDPYDDQRLFDRMNSRGLPLSESEKFKSQVIAARRKGSGLEASKQWQTSREQALKALNTAGQTGSLAIRDGSEAERRLLAGWLIANEVDLSDVGATARKAIRSLELDPYDFCLEQAAGIDSGGEPADLLNTFMPRYFKYVRQLKTTYASVYSFVPAQAGLQHAQIIRLPYLDAAIAACFVRRPTNQTRLRLNALSDLCDILALHKAWNRGWASNERLEVTMLTAIHILKTQPTQNLKRAFADLVHNAPVIGAANAPKLIPNNRRWIRYFLGRLAWEMEKRAGIKNPPLRHIDGKGPEAPEIEHMFARRFQDNGRDFHFNAAAIREWRERLGALTLLSRRENGLASNRKWEERLDIYKSSNLLTRTISEENYNIRLQLNVKSEELRMLNFSPWSSITKDKIEERETSYADLAMLIWSPTRLLRD